MAEPQRHSNIPVSVSLAATMEAEGIRQEGGPPWRRLLYLSFLGVCIAVAVSAIAKLLIYLIELITNISFFGKFSFAPNSPADNHLGLWVIFLPALGGVVVGLMALYGSRAIRGHGIPEAMEQILTNQSKIKPTITYLKPLSSAISIGTGGPFGAEGPIIATGGALGSTLGQILKITHQERKVLLAAGATAGMTAIFGTPVAAIFLAVELLLFEFSPRSMVVVALACITGAAGHHLFFGAEPVFGIPQLLGAATNKALAIYSVLGLLVGLLSVGVTKVVYWIEDGFERLPIHWMWWPALGGLAVGVVGYFAPRTLGVGYNNITDVLAGSLALKTVLMLCILKFVSWAIALGSGTSGGTLAPLLTIGGATGWLLGSVCMQLFPEAGINLSMAALIGMAALFAGASRALLTSILFALEATRQPNALLPLLAACAAAYVISYLMMENTIMTEKISRRGVRTPVSYEPDVLEKAAVAEFMQELPPVFSDAATVAEVLQWQAEEKRAVPFAVVCDLNGEFKGLLALEELRGQEGLQKIEGLVRPSGAILEATDSMRDAVNLLASEEAVALPVTDSQERTVIGLVTYREVLEVYRQLNEELLYKRAAINLRHRGMRLLVRGKRLRG